MNFEELKNEMNQATNERLELEGNNSSRKIDFTKGKNNPVAKIRANMKKEIITQLVCMVIFMAYPFVINMAKLNEAVYFIFMFITSLMTMGYLIKLGFFLRKTDNFSVNTKDTIKHFIFEVKLTLEVYKSFIIAGSLLLPIPVFALIANGGRFTNSLDFEKWFLLQLNGTEITLLIVGYLLLAVFFYYVTAAWTKLMYGKYLKQLEEVSQDLTD
jgi:hypothetical protein